MIRVDHVQNYKVPKVFDDEGNEIEPGEDTINNAAPKAIEGNASTPTSSAYITHHTLSLDSTRLALAIAIRVIVMTRVTHNGI